MYTRRIKWSGGWERRVKEGIWGGQMTLENHLKSHTEAYYGRPFLNIYIDERNLNGVTKT